MPSHITAKLLAQRNGIDPGQIQFLPIGGPADRIKALLAGKVDISSVTALGQKPLLDAIDSGQVKVLTTGAKEFPELPLAYDIVTDSTVKDQAPMLGRFVRAEIKGYRWAQQNPEKAGAIAAQHIKDVELAVMQRGVKDMADLGVLGLDGGITLAGADKTQQALVDQKALAKPLPPADIVEVRFAEQAVKDLGK